MTATDVTPVPNHHAGHAGCSGLLGGLAGLTMIIGRSEDAELAMTLTGAGAGNRVVDLGCGPGTAARFAAGRGAQVTGVDPAGVMLRLARRLTPASAGVEFVEGSAESLPLPDGSADVVWTIASVHHWHDVDAGLAEIRRVLEPGGRLLAMERRIRPGATGLASHGWTDEQAAVFAGMCRDHGFDEVRVERDTVHLWRGRGARNLVAVVATSSPNTDG
jgi:ubiquinone/menaquinone biosynthesis C-methylase UbiE